ncbi:MULTISPECIES: hypothetical protein [unclassified Novosphingobium]|uniref:hypothetical protein n=1 Tax=unclassified Novosphingobium TaxID=2644732 RepID=UPI000D306849|nr:MULTISPECIES: hypothetical protein [unclassified Novosphingobium]PTR06416.1 hypothetical protein C8K11_12029 [Novosphingobium sp. GV055]PUA94835.1 hypothetical protein C8K12_12029 [Novosphingobium sp. GV061]PUB13760.1 hypothetical protein C8K14_12029 [Novosphingobium sp. GV079]PUB38458.1 hypothetical protein C8K10_12029 [Novosphingobium sp. GV027]
MAFEDIEAVNPAKAAPAAVPPHGVAVSARKLGTRNGVTARYIKILIGPKLAEAISLVKDECNLRLAFGTGDDAGLIQVVIDNAKGPFLAKRQKTGAYALTINAATADGLFSLDFPRFDCERLEALRPSVGQPPHFVFCASEQMLAVD